MFTRKLGRSGIEVSAMGLGCWAIGGPWWYVGNGEHSPCGWGQIDDTESIRAIHVALDMGINFLDTADVYGCGHSERVLGEALAGRRDQVVIATKFGKQFDEEKKHYFGHETSPALIRRACEDSLRRLNTDYIDLYQFHWADYEPAGTAEVRETLEELVAEGKIRWYGWSTDEAERVRVFAQGKHCTAIQSFLSVLYDAAEVLATCEEHNLASVNKQPLAMGLLTGKFTAETTFPKDDIRHEWDLGQGRLAERVEQVKALGEVLTSDGRTMVQGSLAWIWARSECTIPIPGFKNAKQVEENARAMDLGPLNAAQMRQVEELMGRGHEEQRSEIMSSPTNQIMDTPQSNSGPSRPHNSSPDQARLMVDRASKVWKSGSFDEALDLLTRARQLAAAAGDKSCLADALYHLGELAYVKALMMQAGEIKDALALHEQCLALRQEIPDLPGVTLSLSRLGVLHERLSAFDAALAYHKKAIALAEEVAYPLGLIRPYTHIGGHHRRNGDLRTALTFYQKALDISLEVDSREDIVFGLDNVGLATYRLDGDAETALGHFRRALEIAKQIDFKFAIGRTYHALAEVYFSEGDMEQALQYARRLAQLSLETGYRLFLEPANRCIEEIRRKSCSQDD